MILFNSSLFAQVIIKENIEITTTYKYNMHKELNEFLSAGHTVRFEINWDKPYRQGLARLIYPSNVEDTNPGWISGGAASSTINNILAPVFIMFQFKVNLDAYEKSTVSYKIFVDEKIVISGSSILTGRWSSIPYENVTYLLEEKECGKDADECFGDPVSPEIKTKQVIFNNNICEEKTQRGGFIPNWNSLISNYNVEICFNKNENVWNFHIENDELLFEYQLTNCLANLRKLYPKLIYNIEDININNIPEEDFCEAYGSFKKQEVYGKGGPSYYILECTVEHEKIHRNDWIEMLNQLAEEQGLAEWLVIYKPNCDLAETHDRAIEMGESHIATVLRSFKKEFTEEWRSKIGAKKNSPERRRYEQKTQDKIKDIIYRYIQRLDNLYPTKLENCK